MDFTLFTCGQQDINRRLDRIIEKIIPNLSYSLINKNIRTGFIRVNTKKVAQEYRIQMGDVISIASILLEKNQEKINIVEEIPEIHFDTLFKNEYCWIINKPYNISVQSSQKNEYALDSQIRKMYTKDNSLSFVPGPVHRLDKKTTGVLCFSQNLIGAQWLSKVIADKTVKKEYIAVVSGKVGKIGKKDVWIDSIDDTKTQTSFKTVSIKKEGKEAITHITPLAHGTYLGKPISLVHFDILTGRTHQIRVQSSFRGFSLLGDTAYGGFKISEKQDFFLHSFKLSFSKDNPLQLPEYIIAPLPLAYEDFLKNYLPEWDYLSYTRY
jgi:23S rRNA pseudouridine955/2504/2580 synthase